MRGEQGEIRQRVRSTMIQDETQFPVWCDRCATDAHIVIESVRRPHWAPCNFLDVTYFCTKCDSLYEHLVKDDELNANFAEVVEGLTNRVRV